MVGADICCILCSAGVERFWRFLQWYRPVISSTKGKCSRRLGPYWLRTCSIWLFWQLRIIHHHRLIRFQFSNLWKYWLYLPLLLLVRIERCHRSLRHQEIVLCKLHPLNFGVFALLLLHQPTFLNSVLLLIVSNIKSLDYFNKITKTNILV